MDRIKIEIGQEFDAVFGNFQDRRGGGAMIDVNEPVTVAPVDPANADKFAVEITSLSPTSVTAKITNIGTEEVNADFMFNADGDTDSDETSPVSIPFGVDVDSPNAISGGVSFSDPRDPA